MCGSGDARRARGTGLLSPREKRNSPSCRDSNVEPVHTRGDFALFTRIGAAEVTDVVLADVKSDTCL
ncbi:MAG TPA: hypothetical protein ENJ18_19360 [Nannocystis exedens]|nr:hypothetical protein [Nannocystis exedens]